MNSIERALGILLLLTGGKLVPATILAERFQVSLRTIYRDIDRLLALGIPIDAERGAEGGYRLAKDFLQPPVALTRDETAALLTALALVRGVQTVPLATSLQAAENKLIATLPKGVHDLLRQADRIIGVEPVPHDIFHGQTKAKPTKDWQTALDGFMQGLLGNKRVRFEHIKPERGNARAHDVEPYGVLYDRNLWYLTGRSVDTDEIKIYRADRVSNMDVSGFRFTPPKDFTIKDLLGGAWLSQAMQRWEQEGASAKIVLTQAQARLLSKDWYYRHAFFSPAGENKVLLTLPNSNKTELFRILRWLGSGAELIEPKEFRAELKEEFEVLAGVYQTEC